MAGIQQAEQQLLRADAVIVAHNDVDTVAQVAGVAACAPQFTETIVVDAASDDDTAARAESVQGARVIRAAPGYADGTYALIGAEASTADVLVFLDADLVGLRQSHLETLIWPVREGECGMACGLFDRGPFANQVFARLLPIVDRQRAVHRTLLKALDSNHVMQFSLEAALNSLCAGLRIPTHSVVLPGLTYVEDPARGRPPLGLIREHIAVSKRFVSYMSYILSHRPPAPAATAIGKESEAAA